MRAAAVCRGACMCAQEQPAAGGGSSGALWQLDVKVAKQAVISVSACGCARSAGRCVWPCLRLCVCWIVKNKGTACGAGAQLTTKRASMRNMRQHVHQQAAATSSAAP